MVGVGRDLCGSSSPTLLPKQGHLQQAAQDLVQTDLEYLQRRRLHNLPGQHNVIFEAKTCTLFGRAALEKGQHFLLKIKERRHFLRALLLLVSLERVGWCLF